MKAPDGPVVYLVPLALGYVADLHRERDAAYARVATLEARIAELTRERDEARFERDSYISAHNELEEVAKVIRAERDEAVGLLRRYDAWRRAGSVPGTLTAMLDLDAAVDAFLAHLAAAPESK